MSSRIKRLWQPGNPQLRIFLPNFWLRIVETPSYGSRRMPKNCVKFEVDKRFVFTNTSKHLLPFKNFDVFFAFSVILAMVLEFGVERKLLTFCVSIFECIEYSNWFVFFGASFFCFMERKIFLNDFFCKEKEKQFKSC